MNCHNSWQWKPYIKIHKLTCLVTWPWTLNEWQAKKVVVRLVLPLFAVKELYVLVMLQFIMNEINFFFLILKILHFKLVINFTNQVFCPDEMSNMWLMHNLDKCWYNNISKCCFGTEIIQMMICLSKTHLLHNFWHSFQPQFLNSIVISYAMNSCIQIPVCFVLKLYSAKLSWEKGKDSCNMK